LGGSEKQEHQEEAFRIEQEIKGLPTRVKKKKKEVMFKNLVTASICIFLLFFLEKT
jgi:hypothetical protein